MSRRISIDTGSGGSPIQVRSGEDSPPSSPSTSVSLETASTLVTNHLSAHPAATMPEVKEELSEMDPMALAEEMQQREDEEPPDTVVRGIADNDLWAMLRQFDKQINHVQALARRLPPNQPDLRMTTLPDVAFRSDTFKSNFERVVTVVGPTSMMGIRQIMRLTDWDNELLRTGTYCAAYFTAWILGYTVVVCAAFAAVLICFPTTRRYLFPPPPLPFDEVISETKPPSEDYDESPGSGKERKIKVRHRTKAEKAEEQASEAGAVLSAFTQTIFLGSDRGWQFRENSKVGPKNLEPSGEAMDDDPVIRDEDGAKIGHRRDLDELEARDASADAVIGAEGIIVDNNEDVQKVTDHAVKRKRDERDLTVAKMAKRTETSLGAIADIFEMLQNAFSPPAPYPDHNARFKIAAVVVFFPAVMIHIVPARMWGRLITFFFGAALWGSRYVYRIIKQIDIPDWVIEAIDPRNTILSGTPTQAQLVLYLLREAERQDMPLRPPPPAPLDEAGKEALKDPSMTEQMSAKDQHKIENATSAPEAQIKKAAVKSKHRIAHMFQKVSRKAAGLHGDVSIDGENKKTSWIHESKLSQKFGGESPDAYACRLNKQSGHLIVDGAEGRVAWLPVKADRPELIWGVDNIVELKKDSISTPRMVAGWLGDADIQSLGLTIRLASKHEQDLEQQGIMPQDQEGHLYRFERVDRRDSLFNRLVALGQQRWEIM